MQAMVAIPGGLGLAAGAVGASSRFLGSDSTDGTVEVRPHESPDDLDSNELGADPAFMDDHGLSVGDQLRLTRTDTEYAVYTIVERYPDGGDAIVRTSEAGRNRLDITNSDWIEDGECPTLDGDATLPADPFEVAFETTVSVPGIHQSPSAFDGSGGPPDDVPPEAPAEDAPAADLPGPSSAETATPTTTGGDGELIEHLIDTGGSDVAVIAPHAGNVQPGTGVQAELLTSYLYTVGVGVAGWWLQGYRDGGGAFVRWYVPSQDFSSNSLHYLEEIEDREFDYVISFNGICDEVVRIGGGVDMETKERIAGPVDDTTDVPAVADGDEYAAESDETLVNRLGGDDARSIWIGQPKSVRDEPGPLEDQLWYRLGAEFRDAVR